MTTKKLNYTISGLKCLVGNTPLLAIDFEFEGRLRTIYAKAENLNMTGSIKDRMALYILQNAYQHGTIKAHDHIVEATSGNTGISIAAVGRALQHRVTIFMPDWMSQERLNLIKSLGAEIHLVTKDEGGFRGSIQKTEEMAKNSSDIFLPRQFSNTNNIKAHEETTGPEIWWQLRFHSLKPEAFVAGVGTGGTIMGVGKFLKTMNPNIFIHPLEPANSPTLSTGHKVGKHRIQGISDEFIPPIVDLQELDPIIAVDDGDAIIMSQKLAQNLGIGVGISAGANFLGALKIQNDLGPDAVVVTVFPDDNKKYLTTDLNKEEPVKGSFLTPRIKLQGFKAYKRVCQTCCDPVECAENKPLDPSEPGALLPPCTRRIPC